MIQLDLESYAEAKAARDLGLARVKNNNQEWFNLAIIQLENWFYDYSHNRPDTLREEFTGEQVRKNLEYYLGKIPSPNLMGAIIRTAIQKKMFFPTGRYTKMKSVKSHARKTEIYQWQE